ncbi:hypothetical protein [Shewanella oncorhynchi]|uniref:hypothetical protein n=1 Tax=Shewanella oncorhynchi TaxID=2726434 RepID=UPI003D7BBB20
MAGHNPMPESTKLLSHDVDEWRTVREVNTVMDQYLNALVQLEELQQKSANLLPTGPMNIGKIGEYFAYVYLRHINPDAEVIYGKANEKSWDIAVKTDNKISRYQVKTSRVGKSPAKIKNLEKGFDFLLVILLGKDYFPEDVFILSNDFDFRYSSSFTVPCRGRKGSPIFQTHSHNILSDLLDSIADRF